MRRLLRHTDVFADIVDNLGYKILDIVKAENLTSGVLGSYNNNCRRA